MLQAVLQALLGLALLELAAPEVLVGPALVFADLAGFVREDLGSVEWPDWDCWALEEALW